MCFARSRYFLRVLGLSLLGREHGLGAAFVSQHDRLGETKHPQRRSPTVPFGIDRTNSSQRISRRENSFPVSRRTPAACPPAVPAYGPVVAYGPEHASRLLLRCAPVDVHSHSQRRGAGAQLFNGSHCTPKQVSWSFKRVLGPSTGLVPGTSAAGVSMATGSCPYTSNTGSLATGAPATTAGQNLWGAFSERHSAPTDVTELGAAPPLPVPRSAGASGAESRPPGADPEARNCARLNRH